MTEPATRIPFGYVVTILLAVLLIVAAKTVGKPAGMTQHVRMGFKTDLSSHSSPLDHPGKARRGEGRPALAGEHEGRHRL